MNNAGRKIMNQSMHPCSRRSFLGRCAVCAAGVSALPMLTAIGPVYALQPKEKANIRVLFLYPDPKQPNWPNIGYDFEGRIRVLTDKLVKGCPGSQFLPVNVVSGDAETAKKILEKDGEVDGYLVYMVGCLWGTTPQIIASSGKPVVIVDELYAGSGEFLTAFAEVKRKGGKIAAVSSSRFEDVVEAVKGIECLSALKQSRILVIGADADGGIAQTYGTAVQNVPFGEINDAYHAADPAEVRKCADRWMKNAAKVIEPSREEIEKSAAIYLAMEALLKKYRADAITINCLGGVYSKNMVEAYPCLGFMQLDDEGRVGACEADQRSTLTKLLMTNLAGRPGFISDPVIDTAKNRIIYVHCVGPTKVYGPSGSSNPYHIRSHSEDRKGACNRSLMPLGKMTTTLLFDHNKKQVILHQGVTVENVDDDKACRTKLAVEVKGDVYKLLNYWDQWGWHRVTFYGDLKRQVYTVSSLLGFEVVEEA
jgi:L-fucose isomerase-like protein